MQLLSGDTEVLCSLRGDGPDGTESLLARLPRSGRIVEVTAYSRLHMFTGGPDALGFIDVLPAARVEPLRVTSVAAGPRGVPAEPSDLDAALLSPSRSTAGRRSRTSPPRPGGRRPPCGGASSSSASPARCTSTWSSTCPPSASGPRPGCGCGCRRRTWRRSAAALAKFPEVAYAVATTGPANLAACVVCRDAESLYEFLTAKVGPLPGVERVETSPVVRTVKQASPVASRP